MGRSERPYKKLQERRLLFLFVFFFFLTAIIVVRLFLIQVVKAKDLSAEASKQFDLVMYLPANRGQILDCNHNPLAISIEVEDVKATPYFIKNPEKVAFKLAKILKIPAEKIYSKLTKKVVVNGKKRRAGYAVIALKVDKKITEKIKELKKKDPDFKNIYFTPNYIRFYPYGELAASVLGVVGSKPKVARGLGLYYKPEAREGLELYYDCYLAGKAGEARYEKTENGLPIPGGRQQIKEPVNGYSVVTTIDKEIQYQTERSLKRALKKYKARRATAIVMNPRTGEILAMANVPGFDANKFSRYSFERRKNWALTDIYEPGSTMKVAVVSAALEEKKFNLKSRLYLPSKLKVGGYTIGEAHHRPAGSYTVETILVKSYNIGSSLIARALGKKCVYEYYRSFGFGEKTGIDFPGEAKGQLPKPECWSAPTIYTISYGQGIGVTPLQMLLMVSTIANQGIKVRPHFLKEVRDERGKIIMEYKPDIGEKVLTTKTSNEIKYALEKVTTEGTGKEAAVKGYRVAGKTGTALKPKPGGGYLKGAYVASFVGFAPVRDPRVAIIVVLDEPKNGYYGGIAAAPVFREIMEFSLRHLKIPSEEAH
jgi:stage V sporulation protein D (sporulation-specific penicillin-binding protein)